MSHLRLQQLEKTYPDGTQAVRGIDLSVEQGEFIVLLGPSGCGKTTSLRMIAGLEIPTGGVITLAGDEITRLPPSRRNIGFVFQFYALYPHLSVRENILFPLKSIGMDRARREQALENVARQLDISHMLGLYPNQLSGGDHQRVALARAMVRQPNVYLMDEPLGTLDAELRAEVREFIRRQQQELRVTTIYVTHDQEEAMHLADRIVVMEGGLIRQAGPPERIYGDPENIFVANFVGSPGMNLIEGRIETVDGAPCFKAEQIDQPGAPAGANGAAILGVRPECVVPCDSGPFAAEVLLNEYMGMNRFVHLATAAGRLIARVDPDFEAAPGERLRYRFETDRVAYFDKASGDRIR